MTAMQDNSREAQDQQKAMLKSAFKNIDSEMAMNMVKIAKITKKITTSIKTVKGIEKMFKKM